MDLIFRLVWLALALFPHCSASQTYSSKRNSVRFLVCVILHNAIPLKRPRAHWLTRLNAGVCTDQTCADNKYSNRQMKKKTGYETEKKTLNWLIAAHLTYSCSRSTIYQLHACSTNVVFTRSSIILQLLWYWLLNGAFSRWSHTVEPKINMASVSVWAISNVVGFRAIRPIVWFDSQPKIDNVKCINFPFRSLPARAHSILPNWDIECSVSMMILKRHTRIK